METIEIGYNKKYLTLLGTGVLIAILAMNYTTFFTHYFEDRYKYVFIWKIVAIALTIYVIIDLRKFLNRIKKKKPYIIISKTGFSFYKKDVQISYKWSDITGWDISRSSENNTYLTLLASGNNEKIDVSWLDKKPKQIVELIQHYKLNSDNSFEQGDGRDT